MGCRPEDVRGLLNRLAAAAEETQDPVRRRQLTSLWGWMAIHSQRLAEAQTGDWATGPAARGGHGDVRVEQLRRGKCPDDRPHSQKELPGVPGSYANRLRTNLDDACREALRLLGDALA
jgi:hypothetical protein